MLRLCRFGSRRFCLFLGAVVHALVMRALLAASGGSWADANGPVRAHSPLSGGSQQG